MQSVVDRRFANICESTKDLIGYDNTEYVSTFCERSALKLLKSHGCVFIQGRSGTGKSGTGKSRLGLRLLADISTQEGRVPVILTSPKQWKLIPQRKGQGTQLYSVMLDNIFGSSNIVEAIVDEWSRTFNLMWPSVASGHIYLVITSRPEIYSHRECQPLVNKYHLIKNMPVLTIDEGEYAFRPAEKKKMINVICQYKADFTNDEFKQITQLVSSLGFPQCCKFYANSKQSQIKRVNFFLKPHDFILEEIERLEESDSIGYYVLLLVLMTNGGLKTSQLLTSRTPEFRKTMETLQEMCPNLSQSPSLAGVREKVNSLCGVYLHQNENTYKFQHQSIQECMFVQISRKYPEVCIQLCPETLLVEHVRTTQHGTYDSETMVYLNEEHYAVFADRITDIMLLQKSPSDILNHPSLREHDFVQFLFSRWNFQGKMTQIWQCRFNSVKQVSYVHLDGTHLALFQVKYLVPLLILKEMPMKGLLLPDQEEFHEILQECLPCATYVGDNVVAQSLLDTGVKPDENCFRALCTSSGIKSDIADVIVSCVLPDSRTTTVNTECRLGDFTWDSIPDLIYLFTEALLNGNHYVVRQLADTLQGEKNFIFIHCLKSLFREMSRAYKTREMQPAMTDLYDTIDFLLGLGQNCISANSVLLAATHSSATTLRLIQKRGMEVLKVNARIEDPNIIEQMYPTSLQQAAAYGGEECLDYLLKLHNEDNTQGSLDLYASLLLITAEHGNVKCAALILDKGVDVNVQDSHGNTPMHLAVKHSQANTLKFLIGRNASVNIRNHSGHMPLACLEDVGCPKFEILKLLMEAGSDMNQVDKKFKPIIYRCAEAGDLAGVKLLSSRGADLNVDVQEYALYVCKRVVHVVCQNSDVDVLKAICEYGATLDVVDFDGETVLHKAAGSSIDAVEKLKYLLDVKQIPLDVTDNGWRSALFPALRSAVMTKDMEAFDFLADRGLDVNQRDYLGNNLLLDLFFPNRVSMIDITKPPSVDFIKLLLAKRISPDAQNNFGKTLLHYAVEMENVDMVSTLISEGVDPCVEDAEGKTVLHYVAKRKCKHKYIKLLLDNGVDPSVKDAKERTALHYASRTDNLDSVKLLLERGIDPCLQDHKYETALHCATKVGHSAIVELLLKYGAEPNIKDQFLRDCLHIAAALPNKDIIVMLLGKGADPSVQNIFGQTVLHCAALRPNVDIIRMFLDIGTDANIQDHYGMTALHYAAENCDDNNVRLLLEKGAKAGLTDHKGMTALHIASIDCNTSIVKLLLDTLADPCIQDKQGRTPLHYASELEVNDTMKLLLENGAVLSTQDDQGKTPLHIAVQHQHHAKVSLLLDNGADLGIVDKLGKTPLHYAESMCTAKQLLDNGADPCTIDQHGKTALHYTTERGFEEVMKLLLHAGADPNIRDEHGKTALHYATQVRQQGLRAHYSSSNWISDVRLLLQSGADAGKQDNHGKTAFHVAVENACSEGVRFFLHSDLDINIQDQQGKTALHYAAKRESSEFVYMLQKKGADSSIKDNQDRIALHYALGGPDIRTVQLLSGNDDETHMKDNIGKTALHFAAESNNSDIVKFVLEKGLKVNLQDEHGTTALHHAARVGNVTSIKLLLQNGASPFIPDHQSKTVLHFAAESPYYNRLELLLEVGLDMDAQDQSGKSALHYAAQRGHAIGALLGRGANPCIRDNLGRIPLHYAAQIRHSKGIELLLEKGVSLQDQKGKTSLHYAARSGLCDNIEFLLNKCADTCIQDDLGRTALHCAAMTLVKVESEDAAEDADEDACDYATVHLPDLKRCVKKLLLKGADPCLKDQQGRTPLHFAVQSSERVIIELLLQKQADPCARDERGRTPLHYAAESGAFRSIRLLLQKGADLCAKDERGRTPLHYAGESGASGSIRLLLWKGADLRAKDVQGMTPLHCAARGGALESVSLLLKNDSDHCAKCEQGKTPLHYVAPGENYDRIRLLLQ